MTHREAAEQLCDIYYTQEDWHTHKMKLEDAKKYHRKLLGTENIIYYDEGGKLLGYCEYWILTPEQFDRIKEGKYFSAYWEEIASGDIVYIANLWIQTKVRRSKVFKILQTMLYAHTKNCSHIAGHRKMRGNRLGRKIWEAKKP